MLPPRVPTTRILRSIPRTARNPIDVFGGYLADYGENFILSLGKFRRTHFTVDADVIEHVLRKNHRNYEKSEIQTDQMATYLGKGLLTNTGADWLRQRRLIQPGFHRERLAKLVSEMQSVIHEQLLELERSREAGASVNLYDFCRHVVFRVIVRAIFTDGFDEAETAALGRTLDEVQGYVIYPIRMPFLRKPLQLLGQEAKYVGKTMTVRRKIQERIDARRAGTPKDDLLQMLLDSRFEDTGEPMPDDRLIDEIMILFAAGHETSANSLSWTTWLLLRHPAELARVRAEIGAARADGPDRPGGRAPATVPHPGDRGKHANVPAGLDHGPGRPGPRPGGGAGHRGRHGDGAVLIWSPPQPRLLGRAGGVSSGTNDGGRQESPPSFLLPALRGRPPTLYR